jgi:hypothetical protein
MLDGLNFENFLAVALIEKDAGRDPKGKNERNTTWAGLTTWPLSLCRRM